jgi:hypothetical protein
MSNTVTTVCYTLRQIYMFLYSLSFFSICPYFLISLSSCLSSLCFCFLPFHNSPIAPVYPKSLTTYINFILIISFFFFLVLFIGLSSLLFISCTALYQAYDFHYFILPFLLHLYSIPLASCTPINHQIYFQCHIFPHPF